MPSYGIRRIHATVVADQSGQGPAVQLIDLGREDVAGYIEQITEQLLSFEPDILGFSIYVWSTDCTVAIAREIKRRHPATLIVFGGPSARSALFDLDYYRDPNTYLDALVEGDGEAIFGDIAGLQELTRSALEGVRGLTLPAGRS
jgi:radical SAM superfamily enzyme YgiQ (UPF0313 family)